ncbi:superoxide dismutase family protein [Williamsia sp. CHRR-6]|uniref:superoxide dismutase[Cu-Zn] n=1 Tax=Williamsia sp. CHRR-6 TaxID=2835871 RepID=UPI001BDA4E82|nr:superoxide dismutase family protein [Williamsia sp. CHRR-6]MBT0567028.1 superoxide dismutase family protein [Williamsia sp. CHRR-6]
MTNLSTPSPERRRTVRRAAAAVASLVVAGTVLAACSNGEEPSSAKGTTPPVISGQQAPEGLGIGEGGASATGESGSGESAGGESAKATLITATGAQAGTAEFSTTGSGVKVDVKVTAGVTPGFHGLHIHAVGTCENNSVAPTGGAPGAFLSAGGHLQVGGRTGHPASGDLISMFVAEDGKGETVTVTDSFKVSDIEGKSILIHSGPDNFGNIPTRYQVDGKPGPDEETLKTGDAGTRVACGVIEKE